MSIKQWIKTKTPTLIRFWINDVLKIFKNEGIIEKALRRSRIKLYSTLIKKGDLVFDVGANVGNRIEPFLEIGAKVVAIEPQEECFKYLHYKFGNKITIVNKGLGSEESIKPMYISSTHQVSSFSKEWIDSVKVNRFNGVTWQSQKNIEITTLDLLIKKYGKPAFIKIDVEGYELEVVKGLVEPIKCISFEYTVPEGLSQVDKILLQLSKISDSCKFNFSIGETMNMKLSSWQSRDDFERVIHSEEFIKSEFGDIYVKMLD